MHQDDVERIVAENPDFPPQGREPYRKDLSAIRLWMLGHAHIDLGYRWDLSETVHRIAPWTFGGVLDVMDDTPGFVFAQSQMFLYYAMEREYPTLFERIRQEVAGGRWEPVGGAWCEYDTALTGGEAVIRQHLYGMQYAVDRLGVSTNRAAFVPDSFIRHPRTLPQILAGCGIELYLFGRGLPQDPRKPEETRRAFRWIGPDGRSVIAYLPFGPYSNPPLTQAHLDRLSLYAEAGVGSEELALYGTGDHGGGPREPDIEALKALRDKPSGPQWRYGRLDEFLDAFLSDLDSRETPPLGEFDGSLVAFAGGALTSQAQAKRWNALLERELVETESALTMSTILQRKPAFPRVDLLDAWRRVMTLQFHDILPGTSVAAVYRYAESEYRDVHRALGLLKRDVASRIASRIDTSDCDHTLVVVNPTGAPFRGAVTAKLPAVGVLRDSDGTEIPSVLSSTDPSEMLVWTELPPYGYRAYTIDPEAIGAPLAADAEVVDAEASTVEVGSFRLSLSKRTGDIDELVDLRDGRILLAAGSNALSLWDEHEQATSWVSVLDAERDDVTVVDPPRIVEENDVRTVVETVSESRYSRFVRRIVLYPRHERIDLELDVEWFEPAAFLKLLFRSSDPVSRVVAGLPYGHEEVSDTSGEFLVHRWVRLSDPSIVVMNDGAYGSDVRDGVYRLSVIRTARDMDPEMAHGAHRLRYAVLPVAGNTPASEVEAAFTEFTAAPMAVPTGRHPGGLKTWGRIDSSTGLPRDKSFASCTATGVVFEVLKMPNEFYSPEGFVVRLREVDGHERDFSVELPLPCARAAEVDHLERELDGRPLSVEGRLLSGQIGARELLTVAAWL